MPQWSKDEQNPDPIGSDGMESKRAEQRPAGSANVSDSYSRPVKLMDDRASEKEKWITYLSPPKESVRIRALFQKVIYNPIITETDGHREDAERIQLNPLWENMTVNAYARWNTAKNPPTPEIGFYGGLHVANRLLAAGVSAADFSHDQTEIKFSLMEMLQQSLDTIRSSVGEESGLSPSSAFSVLEHFLPHVMALEGDVHRAEEIAEKMDFCVLAHEVGHIVHRHGLMPTALKAPDVRRNNEREADARAYSILTPMLGQEYYFLGYLLSMLNFMARSKTPDQESDSHPAISQRLKMLLDQRTASRGFENRFGIRLEDLQSLLERYSS
jgi:hypothetical protein